MRFILLDVLPQHLHVLVHVVPHVLVRSDLLAWHVLLHAQQVALQFVKVPMIAGLKQKEHDAYLK